MSALRRRNFDMYLMVAPLLVWLAVFWAWPLYGVQIAFRDFWPTRGFFGSQFVGFQHFQTFFTSPMLPVTIVNTVVLSLTLLLINFPLAIVLALAINEVGNRRYRGFIKNLTYMPYFFSAVVVVSLAMNFTNPVYGLINVARKGMHLKPVDYFAIPSAFKFLLSFTNLWQYMGWNTIIYLAAIAGINPELYEAATVDGATRWQRLVHITMPNLLFPIATLLVLRIGNLLRTDVIRVLLMQNPLNVDASEVLGTYVYKAGILTGRYSFATAVGLFETAISLLLIGLANQVSRRLGVTALW